MVAKEKVWYLCSNPVHNNHAETNCKCGLENAHKWLGYERPTKEVGCTRKSGAKGCSSKEFVTLLDKQTKQTHSSSDFKSIRDEIREINETAEDTQESEEPTEHVETRIGRVLLSGVTIRLFHKSMFVIVEKYLNVDLGITAEIEADLEDKAMAVVELLTLKATPLNSYLFTWALIIIPPIIGKYLFPGAEEPVIIVEEGITIEDGA